MHASLVKEVDLAAFKLCDIVVLWYDGWERSRGRYTPTAKWKDFSDAFLDHYLPFEVQDTLVDQFLSLLRQGSMTIRENGLRFDSLARYALSFVDTMWFVVGLAPDYVYSCTIASMQENVDTSQIQGLTHSLEEHRH